MPAAGSKLRDVAVLADEGAVVPFELPIRELSRLAPELTADSGIARGELRFLRAYGVPAADVHVAAELTLTCQRCMQPMTVAIEAQSRVHLPADEAAAAKLPVDEEAMLAPEGRARIDDIVAEDLLLELPLSPRHEDGSQCVVDAVASPARDEDGIQDVRRPFAALADMMAGQPPKAPRKRS